MSQIIFALFLFFLFTFGQPVLQEDEALIERKKFFKKRVILGRAARGFATVDSYGSISRKVQTYEYLSFDLSSVTSILDHNYENPMLAELLLRDYLAVVSPLKHVQTLVESYHISTQIEILKKQLPIVEARQAMLAKFRDDMESYLLMLKGNKEYLLNPTPSWTNSFDDLDVMETKFSEIFQYAMAFRKIPKIDPLTVDIPPQFKDQYGNRIRGFVYMISELDNLEMISSDEDTEEYQEMIVIRDNIISFILQLRQLQYPDDLMSVILWGPLENILDRMAACVDSQMSKWVIPAPSEEEILNVDDQIDDAEKDLARAKDDCIEATKNIYSLKANIKELEKKLAQYLGTS